MLFTKSREEGCICSQNTRSARQIGRIGENILQSRLKCTCRVEPKGVKGHLKAASQGRVVCSHPRVGSVNAFLALSERLLITTKVSPLVTEHNQRGIYFAICQSEPRESRAHIEHQAVLTGAPAPPKHHLGWRVG